MFTDLPKSATESLGWNWEDFSPFYENLKSRQITKDNLHQWMTDWNSINSLIKETLYRLKVKSIKDNSDIDASNRLLDFNSSIQSNLSYAEHNLENKLIDSGLEPENFRIPLRNMKNKYSIFREENQPIVSKLVKHQSTYAKIVGSRTYQFGEEDISLKELDLKLLNPDRKIREEAWRTKQLRFKQDREAVHLIWADQIKLRTQIAKNAGFDNFISYQLSKFCNNEYSVDSIKNLHSAIRDYVLPGAQRAYQRRMEHLGLDNLRPWDLNVHPYGEEPLKPFTSTEKLVSGTLAILSNIDPTFANYYQKMIDEGWLHLVQDTNLQINSNIIYYGFSRNPLIIQNILNQDSDLNYHLLLVARAIYYFEKSYLPYWQQGIDSLEVSETISLGLEMIMEKYLENDYGGFYSSRDAALSRITRLEDFIVTWPHTVLIDSFIIWVYENPDLSMDPSNCDQKWSELWDIYMVGIDYEGLEEEKKNGWQNTHRLFYDQLIHLDFSLAKLGALQLFSNYLEDPSTTISNLRKGMALGNTKNLAQTFSTLGIKFVFDGNTVLKSTANVFNTIIDLEKQLR